MIEFNRAVSLKSYYSDQNILTFVKMILPFLDKACRNMNVARKSKFQSASKQWQYHQLKNDHQYRQYEHNKRYPVHTMHVLHPLSTWLIRIFFPQIQVFCQLF